MLAASLCVLLAFAQERPQPSFPGIDRFPEDTVEGGRALIAELACASCHKAPEAPKRGPILGDAGSRLRASWLQAWLADPQKVKPGTSMPRVDLPADAVDALVHFIMSQKDPKAAAVAGGTGKGRELFSQVGCAACHGEGALPLGDLKAKYAGAGALAKFLLDPLKTRPSGRMPGLGLKPQEAGAIATWLVGVSTRVADPAPAATAPGLAYESFEGAWDAIPEFNELKPVAAGVAHAFDVKLCKKEDHVGLRFRGFVEVAKDGLYSFYTSSDDGSRLLIGNTVVVNNDGVHGGTEETGTIELKKGKHALTVEWFEKEGGESLSVEYEGPGLSKRRIPAEALSHAPGSVWVAREDRIAAEAFTPDPARVAQGRELFAKSCAACHALKPGDAPKPWTAPALADLKGRADGCLSRKPSSKAPDFSLREGQVRAIRAALERLDENPSPASRLHQAMMGLNCYACHARDKRGGPAVAQNASFVTSEESMGDEGRLPPHLNGVGGKLRPAWLQTVLRDGSKVRPYMKTRMPSFGSETAALLAAEFEKADATAPEPPPAPRSAELAKAGRDLVGVKGLSCITCHTFNGQKSQGVQATDLVLMTSRLRRDWYERYMPDPAGIRPGTRMPTYWPEGRAQDKKTLGGNTAQQLEAIWQYLSEGTKAKTPPGIGTTPILLAPPPGEAILYRNFIQGAGTRAIGVAYPEGVNLAFDANSMRLALLWKGDFIDASKHWVGRGSGFQGPAGDAILQFPEGAPFAILADDKTPWPKAAGKEAGYQFEGYDLDAKLRPTFLYRFGAFSVRDFFEALPDRSFRRTITLESKEPPPGLTFRAVKGPAEGARITDVSPHLVPVAFKNGRAVIVLDYRW